MPSHIGQWWGNNPERKSEDDIDILLMNKKQDSYILCECKFKNEPFGKSEYEVMKSRASIFPKAKETFFYAFSKGGFTQWVVEQAKKENVSLIGIDDLFEIM